VGDVYIAEAFTGTLLDITDQSTGQARTLTGVAPGEITPASLDAINGSQLHTLGTSIADSLGGGSTYIGGTFTGPTYNFGGTTFNNVGDTFTHIDQSFTHIGDIIGTTTNFYTSNTTIYNTSTTIGDNISDLLTGTAGLWRYGPVGDVYIAEAFTGTLLDIADQSTGATRRIINLSPGLDNTDAVNISQLKDTLAIIGLGTISPDGTIASSTFATGDTTIAGAIENLYATGTTLTDQITNIGDTITNIVNTSTTISNLLTGSAGIWRHDAATGHITIAPAFTGTLLDIADQSTGATRRIINLSPGLDNTDAVNI
jgi:hypothetical protein